jgi:alpha-L-fucosidase 2
MTARFACLILVITFVAAAHADVQKDIEYGKAGDVSLLLDASVPDGAGPFPVAILVHGGGWSGGDKARDIDVLFDPLTKAGFTWFSINYRLAPKYRWPDCFEDVQTAVRWVKANAEKYKGDPNRIALIGYSAGGHLVCLAAVRAGNDTRVQAVVGLAPPTDLELDLPQRGGLSPSLQGLLDRPREVTDDCRNLLRDMSAIHFIKPGLPPFLLIHGTADKSVPYQGSLNFQTELRKNGDSCDLITLDKAPHNISKWAQADPDFARKMVNWLQEELGTAPATRPS